MILRRTAISLLILTIPMVFISRTSTAARLSPSGSEAVIQFNAYGGPLDTSHSISTNLLTSAEFASSKPSNNIDVFIDRCSGLAFPMRYLGFNCETNTPCRVTPAGMNASISYHIGGFGRLSFYIYDNNLNVISDGIESDVIHVEFTNTIEGINYYYAQGDFVSAGKTIESEKIIYTLTNEVHMLHACILLRRRGPYSVFDPILYTHVYLTGTRNKFLKVRVSYEDNLKSYWTWAEQDMLAMLGEVLSDVTNPKSDIYIKKQEITQLNGEALSLRDQGDYTKARKVMTDAVSLAIQTYGTNHMLLTASLANMAVIYQELGEYDKAIALYRRVIDIKEKYMGTNSPLTAKTLISLSMAYIDTRQYDMAEQLSTKAIGILKKTLGVKCTEMSLAMQVQAMANDSMNRHEEAAELLMGARKNEESLDNTNCEYRASLLTSEANNLTDRGQSQQAWDCYAQALTIYEGCFGNDNPIIVRLLINMAEFKNNRDENEEAMSLLKRAKRICEKAYGENHPDLVTILKNMAYVLRKQGQIEDAEKYKQQANMIRMLNERKDGNVPKK